MITSPSTTSGLGQCYANEVEYFRFGNPNRDALECKLVGLVQADAGHDIVFASDSAITVATIFQSLGPNVQVLNVNDVYGSTSRYLTMVAKDTMGTESTSVDLENTTDDEIIGSMKENIKPVWTESPKNSTLRLIDFPRIVAPARQAPPTPPVPVNNTLLSPCCTSPHFHVADLHSLTQYINHYSDFITNHSSSSPYRNYDGLIQNLPNMADASPSPYTQRFMSKILSGSRFASCLVDMGSVHGVLYVGLDNTTYAYPVPADNNALSFYSTVFGLVIGATTILGVILGYFRSHLPSQRIKELVEVLGETQDLYDSAVEDGLLPDEMLRSQMEARLVDLRDNVLNLRSRAYSATTMFKDYREFFMGLSYKFGVTCFHVKEFRASVITTSNAERRRTGVFRGNYRTASQLAAPLQTSRAMEVMSVPRPESHEPDHLHPTEPHADVPHVRSDLRDVEVDLTELGDLSDARRVTLPASLDPHTRPDDSAVSSDDNSALEFTGAQDASPL